MEGKEKVQAEKPNYEQLEKEVAGLKSMNNQLVMQLQQMNMGNLFKRLDYLFKVVEFREALNANFAKRCADEIEELMTPPEAVNVSDDKE
nr:MAG TPA: RAS guanyl-releasing protein 1 Protein [Bacteriophage sp.]